MLEAQRKVEVRFVEEAQRTESAPQGWPAALLMFHVGMWRERLHNAFAAVAEGRDYERPPKDVDGFNDDELPRGIGTPLAAAAARADHLLGELIRLYDEIGERPLEWNIAKTTTEAVLRVGYTHPRSHMFDYYNENASPERAHGLFEDGARDMRDVEAPPMVLGAMLYNLAVVRVAQGRFEDAVELLREAFPMRPDLHAAATTDDALGGLRTDPRFLDLVKS